MLQRPDALDAVAVFSGAPDHFRHVSMCMERGLHAISAVPAVMTLEEADGLRDLKERSGLRYMMAETSYFRQPTIYARNLHGEGGFGEIFYSELEYYHDRGDPDALCTSLIGTNAELCDGDCLESTLLQGVFTMSARLVARGIACRRFSLTGPRGRGEPRGYCLQRADERDSLPNVRFSKEGMPLVS